MKGAVAQVAQPPEELGVRPMESAKAKKAYFWRIAERGKGVDGPVWVAGAKPYTTAEKAFAAMMRRSRDCFLPFAELEYVVFESATYRDGIA